ncbi:MAG TPA: UvrD-helicase domain-containing protein [Pyrinomonadaceae bacterium]|nr:UvrD-helicase domain-containing protein [Pyrinomonadaceae bacterium]
MTDFLSSLNEEQRQAVLTTEGPLLILAGAGSGKTRVIAHRIAYLIAEKGVAPWNVLAVTFTNKAADEMRRRVQDLLRGQDVSGIPRLSTFHSLCVRILRQDIEQLKENYSRTFTVYDQDDSLRLIRNCLKELGLDEKQLAPRAVQAAISAAKNRGESATSYAAQAEYGDQRRASIAQVYQLYETRLHNNNALDFDDLLVKTVQLLRKDAEVREKYNNKFRYILVDEYQDTNLLQFALIRLLTEKQQNICVVGDEDQSIYKWRGADINNILDFEKHFANTKTIRLEQNYRSTQTILDVAGSVVQNNVARKGKNLWTSNPAGDRVRYYQARDGDSEARFVAGKILQHRDEQYDIRAAVLYRTNSQSRVFEEAMRRAGLSYNIVGGFSFYERMEVRDIIAYLKLALNPTDSIALARVINSPPRGIGKQTLDEVDRRATEEGVSNWEAISLISDKPGTLNRRAITALKNFRRIVQLLGDLTDSPVSEVVKAAIFETGYENHLKSENTDEAEGRLENLQELVNAAIDYDKLGDEGLREFIDHSALVSDQDQYQPDAPVTLMTIHSAKGLEFPLVFIVGLEEGLFPHSRAATDDAELEEERRLCYVAMTRAEKFLYVSHAMKRRVYGQELASEPSRFLNEMPPDLIEDVSTRQTWLSLGSESRRIEYEPAQFRKERKKFSGKTYDSVESIAEFFKQRSKLLGQDESSRTAESRSQSDATTDFAPGSYVRHAKYGRGMVLRREGAGDSLKLTITFAGYGQKKLVQKYAGLEKA